LWLAFGASARASQTPEPLTAQERAQGYREHRIIAKPRAEYREVTAAAETRERMSVRRSFPRLGHLRVLDLDSSESADRAIARLRATGRYEYVERDQLLYARVVPSDPSFAQQWPLRNTAQTGGTSGADIAAVAGWDQQSSASNIVVAIIDSGARLTHQDLAANLWTSTSGTHGINAIQPVGTSGYNNPNDDSGHGTHVAGIIGAVGNNGVGVAGVAWAVKLMPLKFIDSTGSGATSDAVECINYAIANGAKVINASYGAMGYSSAQYEAIKARR
jgi:subtilisin family serine protease